MTKEQQKEALLKVFNVLRELEFPMTGTKAKTYSDALEVIAAVHNSLAQELKNGNEDSKAKPQE